MDFSTDISICLEKLRLGGLILYPTDTVWGIGCDACDATAVERIFSLKKSPAAKSMIILVSAEQEIIRYIRSVDLRIFSFLKTIESPTTVIYPGAEGLAPNLIASDGSIGIRVVKEPFSSNLVRKFGRPIVSTSANISGRPAPRHFGEIEEGIRKGVDYIVRYRQQDVSINKPSSLVRWNDDGTVTVIRP